LLSCRILPRQSRAVDLADGYAVKSDLKPRPIIATDDVEKAQIVRHARQVFGFDRLPTRHPPAVQMAVPEHQQPTLVDRPDNIGLCG
jgi:hypothetical protein